MNPEPAYPDERQKLYPFTLSAIMVFSGLNLLNVLLVLFADSLSRGGYNECWVFFFPFVALLVLSHAVLLLLGIPALGTDVYRYSKSRENREFPRRLWKEHKLFLALLSLFSLPTLGLYLICLMMLSPKLNDEFRIIVNKRYDNPILETARLRSRLYLQPRLGWGSPLMRAVSALDEEYVHRLVMSGEDLDHEVSGTTALTNALHAPVRKDGSGPDSPKDNEVRQRIAIYLIDHGAKLTSTTSRNPLNVAIRSNAEESTLLKLINAGAPIERNVPEEGTYWAELYQPQTPLMNAAALGQNSTVELLLKSGAKVNARQQRSKLAGHPGYTALRWACEKKQYGIMRILLQHGADPYIADDCGVDVFMAAAGENAPEALNLLLEGHTLRLPSESASGETVLSRAALTGDLSRVQRLLDLGARFDAQGRSGDTALFYAARGGNPKIIRLFVNRGVDSQTLVKRAQESGNQQILSALASAGIK